MAEIYVARRFRYTDETKTDTTSTTTYFNTFTAALDWIQKDTHPMRSGASIEHHGGSVYQIEDDGSHSDYR